MKTLRTIVLEKIDPSSIKPFKSGKATMRKIKTTPKAEVQAAGNVIETVEEIVTDNEGLSMLS